MIRLDGFTADGFGNPIPGNIVDGDVVRVGNTEFRYYAIPDREPSPVAFDKIGFKEYCYDKLGANALEGLTRYGEIIQACRTSVVPAVVGAFDQYEDAQNYRRDKVALFLGVLVTATIITQGEYDAVINNWPMV